MRMKMHIVIPSSQLVNYRQALKTFNFIDLSVFVFCLSLCIACLATRTKVLFSMKEWTTWSVVWDGIQLSFRNLTQRIVSPKAQFSIEISSPTFLFNNY